MNFILREYIGEFCEAYMDDIGIYSNSVAEHKKHVALILQVLRDHGIVDFLCDFDIHYIPGITNTCADPLSRYPHASSHVQEELNALSTSDIHPTVIQRIKNAYADDSFFGPILENPEQYPSYTIGNGLIYTDNSRLCIPTCKPTRESLLYQHHDNENHFA